MMMATANQTLEIRNKQIKQIDRSTVHQICSGQVILSLAVAVKELVENSLDAGATNIEICLNENGSEQIEVIDNGSGIEEANFEEIGMKHSTSKLQEFSDLTSISTFGFRGEALSSLCALSNVVVVTCHKNAATAFRLQFDSNGILVKKMATARSVGTSVSLYNLFATLPVRHKEFLKNIRRELTKMVHLLTAYCLISTNVRISCTNKASGRKTVLISTDGSANLKDNITNIYGAKQSQTLMLFKHSSITDSIQEEYNIESPITIDNCPFKIEGYVSTCEHGSGRSSADRQFIFINKRPCDIAKVLKVINEVYHMFNRHQYPFIFLNITLNKDLVDVNVTPDKRQIYLQHERVLLAAIKASLLQMYERIPSQMNNGLSQEITLPIFLKQSTDTKNDGFASLKRKSTLSPSPTKSVKKGLEMSNNSETSFYDASTPKSPSISFAEKLRNLQRNSGDVNKRANLNRYSVSPLNSSVKSNKDVIEIEEPDSLGTFLMKSDQPRDKIISTEKITKIIEDQVTISTVKSDVDIDSELECESSITKINSLNADLETELDTENDFEQCEQDTEELEVTFDSGKCDKPKRSIVVEFSIKSLITQKLERKLKDKEKKETLYRRFKANINPSENNSAQEELMRELSKDKFNEMEIIGQFNLGFIIAKHGQDLFIIDQHATDEKFNFETLQRTTVMENQILVVPQNLELTAVNENVLLDNLDVFRKNGFDFIVTEESPIGRRIQLSKVPISKNWTFGKDDVEELIFMLSDSPGTMCRPSKLSQMFASRACRKSIMIGTALSEREMKRLVLHMGEIEQPWNCPHGRPTIRHLFNLDILKSGNNG